jgi:hypothetical protein
MRTLLSVVLVAFLVLTSITVAQHGYVGFFELATANWATRLLSLDLVISLSLIAAWMVRDARERGSAFVPYLLVTATFGAAGPLLYLIRRKPVPA